MNDHETGASAPSPDEQPQQFVAPPSGPDLMAITTIAPAAVEVDAFAKAAAHLQMFEKLRLFAIKLTRPTDWHMFGDRPWPMRGAIEKISRALGLNLKIERANGVPYVKTFSSDEKGAYYIITVSGTVSGEWGSLEAVGFCTSRDQFFAATKEKDTEGNVVWKQFFEIKEENIIQAAYTNFVANAIMRYTGISSFTRKDLEDVYGKGAVSEHAYASGQEKKTTADTGDRTEKLKRLNAILLVSCDGIETKAADLLEKLSGFTSAKDGKTVPGLRDASKLSDGRLNVTLRQAEEGWKSFIKGAGEKAAFYEGLLKQRIEGGKNAGGEVTATGP